LFLQVISAMRLINGEDGTSRGQDKVCAHVTLA